MRRLALGAATALAFTCAPASALALPALNTVSVGSGTGSRLLLPTVPGSSLRDALR